MWKLIGLFSTAVLYCPGCTTSEQIRALADRPPWGETMGVSLTKLLSLTTTSITLQIATPSAHRSRQTWCYCTRLKSLLMSQTCWCLEFVRLAGMRTRFVLFLMCGRPADLPPVSWTHCSPPPTRQSSYPCTRSCSSQAQHHCVQLPLVELGSRCIGLKFSHKTGSSCGAFVRVRNWPPASDQIKLVTWGS